MAAPFLSRLRLLADEDEWVVPQPALSIQLASLNDLRNTTHTEDACALTVAAVVMAVKG